MAVLCDQANGRMEIGLNELLTAKCNIGKTFNLDAITMLGCAASGGKTWTGQNYSDSGSGCYSAKAELFF